MKTSKVAVKRGEDIRRIVNESIELLGGFRKVAKRGDTVFITPNYDVRYRREETG